MKWMPSIAAVASGQDGILDERPSAPFVPIPKFRARRLERVRVRLVGGGFYVDIPQRATPSLVDDVTALDAIRFAVGQMGWKPDTSGGSLRRVRGIHSGKRLSAFHVLKSKGPPRFAAQRTEEGSGSVPLSAPSPQEQSEEMTQTDVEGPWIVDVAARRALELAVGKGAFVQAELPADAVGHPAAAEVFVQRRAKTVLRSRAVGFTQEVVRVARVSVDRSGLVREVQSPYGTRWA